MIIRLLLSGFISITMLCCVFHTTEKKKINLPLITTICIYDSLPWPSNAADREEDNFVFYPPQEPRLISFFKNFRLYKIPSYYSWDSVHIINDSLLESRTYKVDTSYYYYARQDTATVVYRFNSLLKPVFRKMSVDSLYRLSSDYQEPSVNEEKLWENMKFAGSYSQGELVTDTYTAIPNRPMYYPDSLIMVYSKNKFWNNVPYAFSYTAEVRKGMKFVKFKMSSIGDPDAKDLIGRKPRMIAVEMKEMHPSNEQELLNAFLAFEQFLTK